MSDKCLVDFSISHVLEKAATFLAFCRLSTKGFFCYVSKSNGFTHHTKLELQMILHQNKKNFEAAIKLTNGLRQIENIYAEKDYWATYAIHTIGKVFLGVTDK